MAAEEAFWLRHAIACYAGAEAVRQLCPEEPDPESGAESDERAATDALYSITQDEKTIELLHGLAQRRCQVLVEHYRPEIEAVASKLLKAEMLTGEQTPRIFVESFDKRDAGLIGW